ncbi:MAG TPA: SulP family inorganic anion transporter [Desulfocapsa sulfexigens]|nr:SulP family inorganic anion transporter [Desulfocapsa sulfexigens]
MTPSFIQTIFPFISWFKEYSGKSFKNDLIAGITVALVLIPQSMAYAQLAGLPSYYGLYASFLPPVVAALFGSSRQLATGPVAVVSMMTAASLEPLAIAGGEAYIAYAIVLAFVVGLFQFLLGVLRLGIIVNLLSHPVVTGFTNAAALIIASSQLSKFFGVHVDKAEHYFETIWRVFEAAFNYTHWPTFLMGLLALAVMIGLKRWNSRLPYVLAAVIITTAISWFSGFEENRTVTIQDIKTPGFAGLVKTLNSNLDHVVQTTEARAIVSKNSSSQEKNAANDTVCIDCHSQRDVELEQLKRKNRAETPQLLPLAKVLELHLKAGVLDQYLAGEKEHVQEIRQQLRSMQLVSMRDESGSLYYVARKSIAPEKMADDKIWRINVGNNPLDPDNILLVGGGEVVGMVPRGIPQLAIPKFDMNLIRQLLIPAIIISILGFMEAISIAKAVAARTGARLDPNQELIGQGLANMTGSFGGSYPISGSFSRSAVNFQAGAVTGMSSVFTSVGVVVALLYCTPLLYHLPQSVLAAIIMMAVVGLLNVHDIKHAFVVKKSDGIISIITFIATLVFAPHLDKGILLGVSLTIGIFFYRMMKPVVAELSLWNDGHYRNAAHYHLKQCKHIAVIRFDGPLLFANISYLEDEVLKIVDSMPELKIIHFKCNGTNSMDASGESSLTLLIERLKAAGYSIYFSGLKENITDIMRRTGLLQEIGENHIFPTLVTAMEVIWPIAHKASDESPCPLKKVTLVD